MNSSVFSPQIRVYHVRPVSFCTQKYLLGTCTLHVTETGILYWLLYGAKEVSENKKKLQRRMYRLNKREGVPTLQGMRQESRLTGKQFAKLVDAGLLDCTKIKHREDYYVVS